MSCPLRNAGVRSPQRKGQQDSGTGHSKGHGNKHEKISIDFL